MPQEIVWQELLSISALVTDMIEAWPTCLGYVCFRKFRPLSNTTRMFCLLEGQYYMETRCTYWRHDKRTTWFRWCCRILLIINTNNDPMSAQCWSSVFDAGPTLSQHWVHVWRYRGETLNMLKVKAIWISRWDLHSHRSVEYNGPALPWSRVSMSMGLVRSNF